jgi:hypothetical protein
VPGYSYRVETSDTDPNCSAPSPDADGVADAYLDLAAFGFTPDPIIFGDSVWYQATFSNGEFYLFGSPQGNMLNFTDDGFVFLKDSEPGAAPYNHLPIPNTSDPNNLLAVLWRDMEIIYDGTRGVTLANLVNMEGAIIEYNGVQDRALPGSTATYDFEVIAYFDAIPDRYEYIFAYNNLSDPVTIGTIGLENAAGTEGVQYGYNDLVLSDGMAICFDQIGSGETAVEITYQVRVDDNAFGILFNEVAHITDNLGSKEAYADVAVRVSDTDLFLSGSSDGLAGSTAYADEDIVRYNFDTGAWSLFLDGSDVGLKGTDVDALHVQADGSILLSLSQRLKIPGFGKVDDSDIIRFIPTSLGEDSAGSFEMYFDGSDHGLKRSNEDVDAIGFTEDGRLVISTTGSFKVPQNEKSSFWCWDELDTITSYSHFYCSQLKGADEDLIVLDSDGSGWEMYFDGSDVLDHGGDMGDVWIDPVTGDIYLSSNEAFNLGSVNGDTLDVFVCHPDSLGSETQCRLDNQLIFDGSEAGLSGRHIDGFAMSH